MLLALFLAVASFVDWPVVTANAAKAVPRLEMKVNGNYGVCSAVVFHIDKDGKAAALTAAHCVEHAPSVHFDLTVNDRHADVVMFNNIFDLAIVTFRARGDHVIALAKTPPVMGAEVAILGYAFGVDDIVAQFGRIAQTYNRETKAMWINADLIFGDSGGAVVDENGNLVGINSRIYSGGPNGQMAHLGAAVPLSFIEDCIDNYFKNIAAKDKK